MEHDPNTFVSGFVCVVGRPNVGKSTLINALVGQKIASVSSRPQTTRRRQLGILTSVNAQLVFVDTPGLHDPRHKLGEYMNQEVNESLEHCDLILFVVDASQDPQEGDNLTANLLMKLNYGSKTLLLLNKADLVTNDRHESVRSAYQNLLVEANPVFISSFRPDQVRELLDLIVNRLSPGPAYFPDDQLTDMYERDSAADLIREACLLHLRDEVPHGIAVRIDEYKERNEHGAYIAATLFVERESHKGIVIGQQGVMLKKIGTSARKEIEAATGRKVFLELRVKVYKNWRNDEGALRKLGFRQ